MKMSFSFLLKSGQRTMSWILPEFYTLLRGQSNATRNFHTVCQNNWNSSERLLPPIQPTVTNAVREMKTKGKLNLRCKDCYFVTRQGRRYVMCKTYPRHKQQAIVQKVENTWILTHAMQSKIRPW